MPFTPIEVTVTPDPNFTPIEREFIVVEDQAAPVAADIEQPYTGETED